MIKRILFIVGGAVAGAAALWAWISWGLQEDEDDW